MPDLSLISISDALLEWPNIEIPNSDERTFHVLRRLRQLIEPARKSNSQLNHAELFGLLRQMLFYYGVPGRPQSITVPSTDCWPGAEKWRSNGFTVIETALNYRITPIPWQPDWLPQNKPQGNDIFENEHREIPVRQAVPIPADPFLKSVSGYDQYTCPGQKEAILSALSMRDGDTLIINLPTGSGKSLVAQVPGLVNGFDSGLTLVIVPTTTLALDLQRRTHELFAGAEIEYHRGDLAFFSNTREEEKNAIKRRIRAGTQGILFTSPESVAGALIGSLYDAAQKGLINYFVVDEAHIISQWGDDFRPAFQQLPGVRKGLLSSSTSKGLKTILLSATFTPHIIHVLSTLFGPKECVSTVSAVHLRSEPRYFSSYCTSHREKESKILELIRYVPRPFIMYTTEVADAASWYSKLKSLGFQRIALVTGKTRDAKREQIIKDWVGDNIDGVVATSAFGVGMDKSNVRTVIHAAPTETFDRFYQEVGRGGRDGRASLSVAFLTQKDIGIARSMTNPTLIGDEKGFARWQSMYGNREKASHDKEISILDLNTRPSYGTQESKQNQAWNMKVLLLMARAGLISLESLNPRPYFDISENSEVQELERNSMEDYFAMIPVRILDPRIMDEENFENKLAKSRESTVSSSNHAFESMLSALKGNTEMADALVNLLASDTMVVSKACRGCPASRSRHSKSEYLYQIPVGQGITATKSYDRANWIERMGEMDPTFTVVLCNEEQMKTELIKAIQICVSAFHVTEVASSESMNTAVNLFAHLHEFSKNKFVTLRELKKSYSLLPLPRVSILNPSDVAPIPDDLLLLERPFHLLFVNENLKDRTHPLRKYRDTAANCISLKEFLRKATK